MTNFEILKKQLIDEVFKPALILVLGCGGAILFYYALFMLGVNSYNTISSSGKNTIYGETARQCFQLIKSHHDYGYKADVFFVNYDEKTHQTGFKALRENQYGTWKKGYSDCSFTTLDGDFVLTSAKSHGTTYK